MRFTAKRGQQLKIAISLRPAESFALFADLLQVQDDQQLKVVASADSAARPFNFEVKKTGSYVLRLQPELLKGGEYTQTITTGPPLKFPVAVSGHPRIESSGAIAGITAGGTTRVSISLRRRARLRWRHSMAP